MRTLTFNKTDVGNVTIEIDDGDVVFLLGPNGAGKSSLVNYFNRQSAGSSSHIISAHRQNWFDDKVIDMSGAEYSRIQQNNNHYRTQVDSRWRLHQGSDITKMVIAKLKRQINKRARDIESAYENDKLSDPQFTPPKAPLDVINSLLEKSNMDISIHINNDDNFYVKNRKYNSDVTYSIAELSDGEKNALLIAADVLTIDPSTLIIMDEPERHLHRSIILPLLSELVSIRSDCSFLISTHELLFPSFFIDSKVLLVRSCLYSDSGPVSWNLDILQGSEDIDEDIKESVLGAKQKIIFVEGDQSSLDLGIYSSLFDGVTIIPKGSCKDVESSVIGIASNQNLQWLNVYGLVDNDNKSEAEISSLKSKGIYTLRPHSVESIYYHPEMIKLVIKEYATFLGASDETSLFNEIQDEISRVMLPNKERLCCRAIEKKIRSMVFSNIPNQNYISTNDDFSFSIDIKKQLLEEMAIFDNSIQNNDSVTLMTRYPIRETGILNTISKKIGFSDRKRYELNVRNLVRTNAETQALLVSLMDGLHDAICSE